MTTLKARHQFYLDDELAEELTTLAKKMRATKTEIMSNALRAYIRNNDARELDARFGPRLDMLTKASNRREGKLDFLTEAFGLFVHHYLTANSNQQPFDNEMVARGDKRFDKYLQAVGTGIIGRRIAAAMTAVTEQANQKAEVAE